MAARSPEGPGRSKVWTEIVIRAPAAAEDEVAAMLVESGALGVSVDQAAPGAPLPPAVRIRAFFDAAGGVPGKASVSEALARLGGAAASARVVSVSGLEDGRWAERWAASLVPFDVGRRFRIEPVAGRPAGDARGRLTIRITPSRAFGTGEHPTTRLCLETMEELALEGRSFLDVGTGSGVLAIAAALLGAATVVALDVDPEAVEVARTNAALNAPRGAIRLACGASESIAAARFDVAAANLSAAALEAALPSLARLLAPGGRLVASGLLPEEADRFVLLASRTGLALLGAAEREGWVRTLHEAARA